MANNNINEKHRFLTHSIEIEKKIYEIESNYQKIELYQSKELGKVLVMDGTFMLSEYDEFIYHEMLSHVPMHTHPNPKKILIIGGGDGATAREILKHKDVEVTLVEIDKEVIRVCKEFCPSMGDWENKKLKLIIDDGIEFVKNASSKRYDIVLIDSTDEKNQAEGLFTKEFYSHVYRILKDDGLVSVQGSSFFIDIDEHKKILKKLKKSFPYVAPYRYEMIVYPGIIWSFILASKTPTKVRTSTLKNLRYYTKEIHKASFVLPPYIKKELEDVI